MRRAARRMHLVAGALRPSASRRHLEAVEVDAEHRGLAGGAVGAGGELGEVGVEVGGVGQAGQRVVQQAEAVLAVVLGGLAPPRSSMRRRAGCTTPTKKHRAGGELEGERGEKDEAALRGGPPGRALGCGRRCGRAAAGCGSRCGRRAPRRRRLAGAGFAAAASAASGPPCGGGEAGGEREAAGVERREPLDVPGEAGRGGAVGGALGDGARAAPASRRPRGRRPPRRRRPWRARRRGPGAPARGRGSGAPREDEAEPGAEADRGRPREQAVGGGGRRGLLRAGHGRGRYPRRAAHSLRARRRSARYSRRILEALEVEERRVEQVAGAGLGQRAEQDLPAAGARRFSHASSMRLTSRRCSPSWLPQRSQGMIG